MIHQFAPDYQFYQDLFDKYRATKDETEKDLLTIINGYLIIGNNPYQKKAVEWRINELMKRKIRSQGKKIDSFEISTRNKNLNKPIDLEIPLISLALNIDITLIDRAVLSYFYIHATSTALYLEMPYCYLSRAFWTRSLGPVSRCTYDHCVL